ncbi:MAG: hypothetical protein FJ279_04500 [Planctomycetes bacterium]|nr:hypothetical protein [Planctomycetota bacterium]
MMDDQLAVSLAVLKVNFDRLGRDYVDNFVPFVVDALRLLTHDEVSAVEVGDLLRQEYGLQIPLGPLRTILKRAARQGFLHVDSGIYLVQRGMVASDGLSGIREAARARYRSLVSRYVDFCRLRFDATISVTDAEAALTEFADRYCVPFLRSVVGVPEDGSRPQERSDHYMFGAFVDHLYADEPECFGFLVEIAKGSMLAQALYVPDISAVSQRFRDVRVFLDTTFLLRALGYSGPSLEAPCRGLVDGLRETGAKPRCFDVTLKEAKGILFANALRLRGGGWRAFGETVDHFRRQGLSSTDVMLLCEHLEENLRQIGVVVEDRPPYTPALTLDEKRLEEVLDTEIRYSNREALVHDLNVVMAIYRARAGVFPRFVEDCRAVFVTTNGSLLAAVNSFMRESFPEADLGVPLAIGDYAAGTYVWLKRPMQMPDLPRDRVIADCYAALSPPQSVWRLYFAELDKLVASGAITPEDHALLRSLDADRTLMELTRGDPEAFTEGTVDEILERARERMRQEAEAGKTRAEELLGQESAARLAAEKKAADKHQEAEDAKAAIPLATAEQEGADRTRIEHQCRRVARAFGWTTKIAAVAVLAAGSVLTLLDMRNRVPGIVIGIFLGVSALAALYASVTGKAIKDFVEKQEDWVTQRLVAFFWSEGDRRLPQQQDDGPH